MFEFKKVQILSLALIATLLFAVQSYAAWTESDCSEGYHPEQHQNAADDHADCNSLLPRLSGAETFTGFCWYNSGNGNSLIWATSVSCDGGTCLAVGHMKCGTTVLSYNYDNCDFNHADGITAESHNFECRERNNPTVVHSCKCEWNGTAWGKAPGSDC